MAYYKGKLTPEIQELICECLENGLAILSACGYANIAEATFYNWFNRGKEAKSGKYKDFYEAVETAKHNAQAKYETVIVHAAERGDWRAAQFWLERRRRDTYSPPQKYEHKVNANVEHDATVNLLEDVRKKRRELNELRNNNSD